MVACSGLSVVGEEGKKSASESKSKGGPRQETTRKPLDFL